MRRASGATGSTDGGQRWTGRRTRSLNSGAGEPRFGSALNLNVHYHVTIPDGVFVADRADGARFVPLPPPTDDEVAALCARAARRIRRLVSGDDDGGDDDPADAAMLVDAARAPLAPAQAVLVPPDPSPARRRTAPSTISRSTPTPPCPPTTASRSTLRLRYGRSVQGDGARPPFAHRRLRRTATGKVAYRLRRPWFTEPDGSSSSSRSPFSAA